MSEGKVRTRLNPRASRVTRTVGFVMIFGVFAGTVSYLWGPRGVIIATLLCTFPLAFALAGIRIETRKSHATRRINELTDEATRWRKLVIVHSHHEPRLAGRGKEFRAGGKLFCAGCYGLLFGTLLGDAAAIAYLVSGMDRSNARALSALLPLAFIPIIARYTVIRRMHPLLRVAANTLLSLGCWFVLLIVDAALASTTANLSVFAGFWVIGYLRWHASLMENRAIPLGRVVVQP